MLIAERYLVPSKCPEQCSLRGSGLCERCPVLLCSPPVTEEDKKYLPVIAAEDYREDWAKEWEKFFTTGVRPKLFLVPVALTPSLDPLMKLKKIKKYKYYVRKTYTR